MAAPKGHPKYKGAGRPAGSPNLGRSEFIKMIHAIGKPAELVSKMKELTLGIKSVKYSNGEETVYEQPPQREAIAYLLDQAYGKAKQSVELEATVRTIEDELATLPDE